MFSNSHGKIFFIPKRTLLRLIYYAVVGLILVLIGYRFYLFFSQTHFESLHVEQVEQIQTRLEDKESFSFAVVGNIKNSKSFFQKHVISKLNHSDHAFVISAGNAVSDGYEENYRSLLNMLADLQKPWLLTYGENEDSDFGDFRFYKYLGPFFFSFLAGNSQFIFLDGSDKSPYGWQLDWLRWEFSNTMVDNRFVFIGQPLHPPIEDTPVMEGDNYFPRDDIAEDFRTVFEHFGVDVVFSSNLSLFHQTRINGVQYITTGGAGGVILDSKKSFHHYVKVGVDGDQISFELEIPDVAESALWRTLDSIWSAVYTFFHVSFSRFLFILCVLIVMGVKLHKVIYKDRDYYTHFTIDDRGYRESPKRIAFFTNTYFPFISGVPISILRLAKGLQQRGHQVHIFAPEYDKKAETRVPCTRVRTLIAFGKNREFRVSNLLQSNIKRTFEEFAPDLVHVHQPLWLGSLGLWRARRAGIPVIYTYHTRLEMYAHYVPLPSALFRNLISHLIVRRFCNRCNGVIVPTYSTETYLRLIGVKSRIFVQPSGVDFDRFNTPPAQSTERLRRHLGLAMDDKVLISVSRLGREKNIKFLIDAMAELQQRTDQSVKLVLVGRGDDQRFLENRAGEQGVADRVLFAGAVKPHEMPGYYQMADLFVFASKSETQGMVILEAMSAGLPVVAIRSSGIDDVIMDGKNGYKTLDNIAEWTAKAASLINDEQKLQRFSEAAVAFAREHDVSSFAENVDRYYSEIMATYHDVQPPQLGFNE